MKKDKLAAIIVFIVVLFVVFVFGLFIGKKLSPKSSKEGTIKESSLINKNSSSGGQNIQEQSPASAGNMKFAPISKLAAPQKENSPKENVSETGTTGRVQKKENKQPPKPKVETKIIYVKKPVYIYKYLAKKPPVKKGKVSPFNSKAYYTIQVAALKHYARAKILADKLNSMGFFSYIVPISVSGKAGKAHYQQVRVGKFSTVKGAKSIEDIIAKKFKVKPYIIKVD